MLNKKEKVQLNFLFLVSLLDLFLVSEETDYTCTIRIHFLVAYPWKGSSIHFRIYENSFLMSVQAKSSDTTNSQTASPAMDSALA